MVEPRTHEVKVQSSNPATPREPVTNIRQSYISEAVIVGCTVYSYVNEIFILGCQCQPVLAGLLQHSALRMLRVSPALN